VTRQPPAETEEDEFAREHYGYCDNHITRCKLHGPYDPWTPCMMCPECFAFDLIR
jgi:hypothetical protein